MNAMKTFNIFEPSFSYDPEDPDGYHAGMDRFGPKIGASRIGASVYELPPVSRCARTTTSPTRSGCSSSRASSPSATRAARTC